MNRICKKKKNFGEQLFGMKKQLWRGDVEMVRKKNEKR